MKNKDFALVFIVALLFFISVGYAYITSNLDMVGTVNINDSKWDIHFANPIKVGNKALPTIKGDNNDQIEYDVTLKQDTDSYDFYVDIVNGGDIEAEIKSIVSKIKINNSDEVVVTGSTLPSYLEYTIKYEDNSALEVGQKIPAGESKKIKVHVGFKDSISHDDYLQALGNTIKLNFSINYVQANVGA